MSARLSRKGLTLLEMMISLPSATILIGAMATCITIMMRTRSQDESLFRTSYDLASAATQIAMDLENATSLAEFSATAVEFAVPDRNGDGLPEQIRYEWGGTIGTNANKVLWSFNNEPRSVMFEDIGAFSLQSNTSSAPSLVANHLLSETAVLKAIDTYPSGVFREQAINANNAVGQYLIPDIPGTGIKWDLGSIRIMVRAADSNLDGTLCVRIMRSDNTTLPIAPILAEIKIAESRLGTTYQWLDIPIGNISWQTQGTPLCITLSRDSGTGDVAKVLSIENGTGMPTNANQVTSTDGGTTWTASTSTTGLRFYAYGFYDGYTGQRSFLTSVDLKIESARNAAKKLETTVRLNASPELP